MKIKRPRAEHLFHDNHCDSGSTWASFYSPWIPHIHTQVYLEERKNVDMGRVWAPEVKGKGTIM